MSDITHGTKGNGKPILTIIDQYQDIDSTKLKMTLRLEQIVQPGAGASDWLTLVGIPIEALVFPESGQRKIKAILSVKDQVTGRVASTAETSWNYDVQDGYLDVQNKESEAHAASLQLAMCIAGEDGKIDDDEVEVIKAWGSKSMNALEPDDQLERNQLLNQALQTSTDALRRGNARGLFEDAVGILNNIDIPRHKYDAYELCLNVLKVDGEAHPSEMANLTKLARSLHLDETKVRIMTDRHTANLKFTDLGGDESDDDFLGITSDMSKEEIRKQLNKLFKKHSARIGHDDSNVADQSRMWLEKIGHARVRHLG
jgi:tellurite resistance protein